MTKEFVVGSIVFSADTSYVDKLGNRFRVIADPVDREELLGVAIARLITGAIKGSDDLLLYERPVSPSARHAFTLVYGLLKAISNRKSVIWTSEQVAVLWRRQIPQCGDPIYHPYTCSNRSDGNHQEIGSDLGMLIPTIYGWMCPFCDYTQTWSHETGERT